MNTNSYLRFLLMVLADDSIEFSAIVGDEDAQPPFALLKDKNLRDKLSDLLEVLDDREHKIILQRFGLDGAEPKTLKEVGKKLGLTRERIRQLQNTALAKLRSRIQSDPVEKFASVKRIAIGMRSDASGWLILKYLNNTRQNLCGRGGAHPYRTAQDFQPVVHAVAIRLAPVLAKSHDKRHRLRIRRRSSVSAAQYYRTEAAIFLPNNYCTSYFLLFMRRSGYQPASLIFRISHQENSPAPNPDADLFPEKCPRLFEPPPGCFGHSTVELHVD
jgi:DNA-binding CsgD family transcriptional regulator